MEIEIHKRDRNKFVIVVITVGITNIRTIM